MDTSRLILLLRAKWRLERTARELAAAGSGRELAEPQFVYQPFAERLVLACAYDHGDRYEYVDARDLAQVGLSASRALELARENTRQQIGSNEYFEKMPQFGWVPSTAGRDECVALLSEIETIRSLAVAGRHLAFAPTSRGFWITGTENRSGIELVCAIALNEYENGPGTPLTPIPFVLGDDGQWQPWLPSPQDPSFWSVRSLQVVAAHDVYESQREQFAELVQTDDHPFVAKFFLQESTDSEQPEFISSAVWGDVETLLPKVDLVECKPLLNRAAMERDESIEAEIGESIFIAWDKLAQVLGERMKLQPLDPERYLVPTFSNSPLWEALQRFAVSSPEELYRELLPARATNRPTSAQAKWSVGTIAMLAAIATCLAAGLAIFVVAALHIMNPPEAVRADLPLPPELAAQGWQPLPPRVPLQLLEFEELPPPEQPLPSLPAARQEFIAAEHDNAAPQGIQDAATEGTWLVGLRVVAGDDWGGVIRSIQPIYQRDSAYELGERIGPADGLKQIEWLAKPGYAVSSLNFQRGLVVNSLQLTFSRVVDDRLDLDDSYQTDWFGVHDQREVHTISGEGLPIVGLTAKNDGGCFAFVGLSRAVVHDSTEPRSNVE